MFLRAAPIDVSQIISEMLFDRMRATVLTSATLTVDGSFDYVQGPPRRAERRRASACRRSSTSPSRRSSTCRGGCRRPSRRDFGEAVAREVAEILLPAREGRAFVLFTSYAMLRDGPRSGRAGRCRIRCSCRARRRAACCSQQFRSTPNAVLLATSSFWQGVDVVGEQLSCVIIDKLPFASPGDPITAARIEAINAEGGDAFQDYQVPLAILAMLQGLGRLIRHRTDRGRAGGARPAAADDGLRPPVPRLVSAGAGDPESRGDHAVFRKLIYTAISRG